MSQLFSRRRVLALVLPATAAVLLLAFRASSKHDPSPVKTAGSEPAPAGEPALANAPSAPGEAPAAPAEPPPIIDDIRVDKSRVCEGEVAIVTVEAHSQTGDDGALRTLVGPTPGKEVPVRLWLDENGRSSLPDVRVFGGKGGAASKPIPNIQVDRCRGQAIAFVEAKPVRNAPEQRQLSVVVNAGGDAGTPQVKSVRWSFGDGTEVNGGLEITHEFPLASAVHPTFLVKANIELANGQKVMGATSIELLDRSAYERRQGRALVVVRAVDRFPIAAEGGGYTQRFRVMNREDSAITIDDVAIDTMLHGDREPIKSHASPSSILPSVTLAPHSEVVVTMTVTPEQPAGVDYRTYGLVGKAADGRPAQGSFSTMVPLGKPSEKNTTPISPALEARVLRARKLLKKDLVTEADVRALEKEGRFADLAQLSDDVAGQAVQ